MPQLAAAEERQLHIWLTPHGFIKGAMAAGNATLAETEGANVISFTALGKYKVDGTIDANNHVTKVETTIANPVLGDTDLVANYSDYRDFSGVQFPARIQIDAGRVPALGSDRHERHAERAARPSRAGSGCSPPRFRRCRR